MKTSIPNTSHRLLTGAATLLLLGATSFSQEEFQALKSKLNQGIEQQPEGEVAKLLELGIKHHKPAQASAVAESWLKHNLPKSSRLPYLLGRNAEMSGNWREAAASYQQFLEASDIKSADTADAITALHSILIEQLRDPDAAYSFARRNSERLAANPRFRQYDRWFLNRAKERNDLQGLIERLVSIGNSGASADHLQVFHQGDLVWLVNQLQGIRLDQRPSKVTQELVDSTRELAKITGYNEELRLLSHWKAAARLYCLERIEGKEVDAPIEEAKQLLAKYPHLALQVQNDWAGGNNSRHHRDKPEKYWPHQLQGKLPPIQKALTQLEDINKFLLLKTWSHRHYDGGPDIISKEDARALALNSPQLVNHRLGPELEFGYRWDQIKLEEARELSPKLEFNPSPEAAIIRTIALAGEGKDLDRMIDHLIKHESWRLNERHINRTIPDQLWHWAGKPGGNNKRDQAIKRFAELKNSLTEDREIQAMPEGRRVQEFNKYWKDYKSKNPKLPGVETMVYRYAKTTPQAMETIIKDNSLEARFLASRLISDALTNGKSELYSYHQIGTLSTYHYNPYFDKLVERHGGIERFKTHKHIKDQYRPHPLLAALTAALQGQVKGKNLDGWLVMAWINAQFPEQLDEAAKLAQQVVKNPDWKKQPAYLKDAMQKRFPSAILNSGQQKLIAAAKASTICKALLELKAEASTAQANQALKAAADSILNAPKRVSVIGFKQLGALKDEVWADEAFVNALADFIQKVRPTNPEDQDFGNRLQAIADKGEADFILKTADYLWTHVERYHRNSGPIKQLTNRLTENKPEAASALARIGLQVIDRHQRGRAWFKREEDIPTLKSIRGKTAMKLGLVEIPVPPNHPNYPVHLAQSEWMTENHNSSWKLINSNWDVFVQIHREMSLPFLMWILERSIQTRDSERQEQLIRSLLSWTSEAGSSLRPTEKAEIEIAYGDIAVQRGQLREAGEIFDKIQKSEEYKDLPIRHEAALRRVRVDRLAKNYDGALQVLTELEMERVPGLWNKIRFARAEIYFDQEEYMDCADDINSILNREPNHPDAKILLGKVQLKQQKLMEATTLDIGSTSSQQSLVPGEQLKVMLSDPTLAVSGAGSEIEVVVWATSGDREQFFLRQFGDQKTKYTGEVQTGLGKPNPDDGTLQVIGDDEVYYAYTERFRAKMNNLEEKRGGPIRIASDAVLMASARKLLSEAEQRRADMQQVMEDIAQDSGRAVGNMTGATKAKLAAKAIEMSMSEPGVDPSLRSAERNIFQIAKPGNPIHIRVVDLDRSRTAEIDELQVSVASSSGDSISSVTLTETETHSGWFEGSIETTGAAARAIAQTSEPGRNPNMVISPKQDYPAWRPIADNDKEGYDFTIDFNDRIDLGKMTITAAEEGAKLQSFMLQTGMNHDDMTTIGTFPDKRLAVEKPWHPSVTVVRDTDHHHARNDRNVHDINEIRYQLERGWITENEASGVAGNVKGISEAFNPSIPSQVKFLRHGRHGNAHVIYRFRGYFYEPTEVTRRFKLELGNWKPEKKPHPSVGHPPQFLLAVNGQPITDPENPKVLEGEMNLPAGINTFEIWATGWDCTIGFGRNAKLYSNLEDPEQLTECPDSFFDPATFPPNSMDHRNSPASIKAGDDGTTFSVDFAKNSKARLLKLVPIQHEGPVPALNKITLSKPDGQKVLPVAEDYAELSKNEILEILAGDRIYVRYRDDRFVTKTKERLERFLNVSFTDALIDFADMEPRLGRNNNMTPYYEKLLRFQHGKPLDLAVHDADMDSTVEPDTVQVTLSNGSDEVTMTATETGDSTGIFKVRIVPVTGSPKKGEFQVPVGGIITATYIDEENDRPGIPTDRIATIKHAKFEQPTFVLADAQVSPWQPEDGKTHFRTLSDGFELFQATNNGSARRPTERIQPSWQIHYDMTPASDLGDRECRAVLGQHLYVEVHASQFALGTNSTIKVYAQTESGRQSRPNSSGPFDTSVPGTIEIESGLTPINLRYHHSKTPTIASYFNQGPWASTSQKRTDDRFYVLIPITPGILPEYGVLTMEEKQDMARLSANSRGASDINESNRSLIAKPDDIVHIGFKYQDSEGTTRWLTAKARTITHPAFDIMSEDYAQNLSSAYAGEYLNLRVVDLGADVSDQHDITNVLMQAKSGAKYNVVLHETGPHSGIFKQNVKLSYTKDPKSLPEDLDVAAEGFPVTYGDTVAARYTDRNGVNTDIKQVTISKGANGLVLPFSKQYEDEEIAMRTQFSLAEAYLEMAKHHRLLGQTKQAEIEFSSAKLLLAKAMNQFTDPNTRAHAEYLLGTLTMEEADTTTDPELKEIRYRAALSRFMTVTGTYSESIHASRAQYRIATVYEKIGEPDIAAQEYVKLAYKYPDSEYLATSMAKLGSHFLKQAGAYEAEAKPLLAKGEEDKDAAFEAEVKMKLAVREYIKTASIFGRLQERFPDHKLAGRAGIQAGQAYMRAKEWRKAIAMFKRIHDEESYDGPNERAAAIFWSAMCYQEINQQIAAYSSYKRLTYDFPESKWAGYARAKLSEESMLKLETQLEIERLEAGR